MEGDALPSGSSFATAGKQLVAGALAGAAAKTCIAPLDRVKIMFQVSQQPFTLHAVASRITALIRAEGLLSLFKGNMATVARYVILVVDFYRCLCS